MPVALLDSQFAILEEPTPDEHPIVVDVDAAPAAIAAEIVRRLRGLAGTFRRGFAYAGFLSRPSRRANGLRRRDAAHGATGFLYAMCERQHLLVNLSLTLASVFFS